MIVEKMLYDQAQLLTSALELSLLVPPTSQDFETLQAMARSILIYVSRDLRSPGGAFYSAEDADSLPGKVEDTRNRHPLCKQARVANDGRNGGGDFPQLQEVVYRMSSVDP